MDISCVILGFNEEKNLPRLFSGLKDISDIVFFDHQSTDNTANLAKQLGARVFTREFPFDVVVEKDVAEFKKRYGIDPEFKAGDKIHRSGEERQAATDLSKNDWVLNLDCDEVITWDIEKVKPMLPGYDVINCRFNHERNPDGSIKYWFQASKLYRKEKVWWTGRVHEVIDGFNLRVGFSEDMVIDHYQEYKPIRRVFIAFLEYEVLKNPDGRTMFYLGKEYHHWEQYEKAVHVLQLYLKIAFYKPEMVKAYMLIAESLWELKREEEAYVYAMQALKINPEAKEPYLFMAIRSTPKDREIWLKHADLGNEAHIC